jgi:dephospho-CoA kinase
MALKVLGLMGAIGCGKGTVVDILVNDYGFQSIATGDLVREEVKKRGLSLGRENEMKISVELRKDDPAYFIREAVKRIKDNNWDKAIIDGVRLMIDINTLKDSFPGIIFVLVKTDPKKRFERMKKRGRPGFPKTFEKFLEHERLEIEKFNFDEVWSNASRIINNDGSIDDLRASVIDMLEDLGWI